MRSSFVSVSASASQTIGSNIKLVVLKINLDLVPNFLHMFNVGFFGQADVRSETDLNHFQSQRSGKVSAQNLLPF